MNQVIAIGMRDGPEAARAAARAYHQALAAARSDNVRAYLQRRLDELSPRVHQHVAEPIEPDPSTPDPLGTDVQTD